MRILCIAVVLFALVGSLSAIDFREKGAEMSHDDEYAADSLLGMADSLFRKRDYSPALEKYLEVFEFSKKQFNRPVETEALAQLARINLTLGNKDDGRRWLDMAGERASDSDPMGWSRYLSVRGRFEWKDDDLVAARKTFGELYDYCNTNALWSRAVDAANMIAIVAQSPEEQIEWSKRGIEAAEAAGVESWLGPLWNNLGGTYYELKQFDSALSCYLKAREYHWRHSGEEAKLLADYHVGMAYRYLGQFDQAAKWLRPVLAWAERLGNRSVTGQALEELGEIEIAAGGKKEGLAMLNRAREQYEQAGFDKTWPEVWEGINDRIRQLESE